MKPGQLFLTVILGIGFIAAVLNMVIPSKPVVKTQAELRREQCVSTLIQAGAGAWDASKECHRIEVMDQLKK